MHGTTGHKGGDEEKERTEALLLCFSSAGGAGGEVRGRKENAGPGSGDGRAERVVGGRGDRLLILGPSGKYVSFPAHAPQPPTTYPGLVLPTAPGSSISHVTRSRRAPPRADALHYLSRAFWERSRWRGCSSWIGPGRMDAPG